MPELRAGSGIALAEDLVAGTLTISALGSTAGNTILALATETISAGAFVNVYNNGGALSVRNANASDPTKFANGFVAAPIANGASGSVQLGGLNSYVTVGATASEVWLSDSTPGSFVTTPPSASGSIIQPLGMAIPGLGIIFTPQARIQL